MTSSTHLDPMTVLAGFESTMKALREMPTFELDGATLLGRMCYRADEAYEHGQMLACRVYADLMTIALQAEAGAL